MSAETETAEETAAELEDPIVAITPDALERISEVRAGEDDPATLVLRIAINGINGVEYSYDLSFEDAADAEEDDVIYQVDDLPVVIPTDSVEKLRGATLDVPSH